MTQEQEQKSFTIFLVYFVIIVIFGWLALFYGRALENQENLFKIMFYFGSGAILLGWCAYDIFVLKSEKQVFTVLHNPDKSILNFFGRFRWRWMNNPLRLSYSSVIVLFPIYLFSAISAKKTFFIAFAQYQIAETASIFTAMEPASFVETLILVAVGGFGLWFVTNYFRRGILFFVGLLGVVIGTSWLMYAYHAFRYAGQDFELLSVIVFFAISMLLIYVTGSIVPALVAHLLNNGFGEAFVLFSSDVVIIFGIVVYVLLLAGFVVWIVKSKKDSVEDRFWLR